MCCASVSARNGDSLRTTSPIASLTTSSKRDMCAPFWSRAEVHEAVQAREEQLVADAHDLLDARHADAREPQRDARRARLDVVARADASETSVEVGLLACTAASVARRARRLAARRTGEREQDRLPTGDSGIRSALSSASTARRTPAGRLWRTSEAG